MIQGNVQTIFEIGPRSFPWVRVIQPAVFLIIGLAVMRTFKAKAYYVAVGVFLTAMASLFLLISLVTFVPEYFEFLGAYHAGKYSTTEGVVENFRAAPGTGPARESFSVNGELFSYNVLDDTPCFRDFHHGDSPLRDGMRVRIYHTERCIQRIDRLGSATGH